MNWVRYANKKEDAIRKREQEWFANKEAKSDNPFSSSISIEKLKTNVKPVKNLDLQRILNLTEETSRKKGRVIVNKVNLDRRSSPKYHSVDLDKLSRSSRRPKMKINGCTNSNTTNSYISTSSPAKPNEKINPRRYEKNHCRKIYNFFETSQVDKHHRLTHNEKDQPFFLKHNDLGKIASLRRSIDFTSRNPNNIYPILPNDAGTAYHSKGVGFNTISCLSTHQSSIFTQASSSWKDDKIVKQVDDYFESSLLFPPKSSKIVSFSDHETSDVKNRLEITNMCDTFKNGSIAVNVFELNHKGEKPNMSSECFQTNVEMEIRGDKECFMECSCFSYTSSSCEGEDVVSDNSLNKNSQEMLKDQYAVNILEEEHVHYPSFASKIDKSEIDARYLKTNWEDKLTETSNVWSMAHCHEKRAANSAEIYHLQKNGDSAMHEDFMKVERFCANVISQNSECNSKIMEENLEGKELKSLGLPAGINTNSFINFVKERETSSACPLKRNCDVESQTDLNDIKSHHKVDCSLRDVACQTMPSPKQTADVCTCTTPLKQVVEDVLNEPFNEEDDTSKALDLSIKKNSQKFGCYGDGDRENIRSREQPASTSEDCPKSCVMSSFLPVFSTDVLEYSNELSRFSNVELGGGNALETSIDNRTPELKSSTVQDFLSTDVKLYRKLSEQCLEGGSVDSEESLYESPLKYFV